MKTIRGDQVAMPEESTWAEEAAQQPLNEKQALFVREYLVDLNATQAAIRAGYAEVSARHIGHENLTKPNIAKAVADALHKRAERTEIQADWVLQTVARKARTGMSKFIKIDQNGHPRTDLSNATPEELDCLTEVNTEEISMGGAENALPLRKVKIKVGSQDKHLELLMRHLGLLNDKLNLTLGDMKEEDFKALGRQLFGGDQPKDE